MDWSSCIICGSRKGEPLRCPVDSPHKGCEQVYKAFLQNVEQFKEFDALPVNLKMGSFYRARQCVYFGVSTLWRNW